MGLQVTFTQFMFATLLWSFIRVLQVTLSYIAKLGCHLWWEPLVETESSSTRLLRIQIFMLSYPPKWESRSTYIFSNILCQCQIIVVPLLNITNLWSAVGCGISCSHGDHGWAISWSVFRLFSSGNSSPTEKGAKKKKRKSRPLHFFLCYSTSEKKSS